MKLLLVLSLLAVAGCADDDERFFKRQCVIYTPTSEKAVVRLVGVLNYYEIWFEDGSKLDVSGEQLKACNEGATEE